MNQFSTKQYQVLQENQLQLEGIHPTKEEIKFKLCTTATNIIEVIGNSDMYTYKSYKQLLSTFWDSLEQLLSIYVTKDHGTKLQFTTAIPCTDELSYSNLLGYLSMCSTYITGSEKQSVIITKILNGVKIKALKDKKDNEKA